MGVLVDDDKLTTPPADSILSADLGIASAIRKIARGSRARARDCVRFFTGEPKEPPLDAVYEEAGLDTPEKWLATIPHRSYLPRLKKDE